MMRNAERYKEVNWENLSRADLGEFHLKALEPSLKIIRSCFDRCINSDSFDLLSLNNQGRLEELLSDFFTTEVQIENHGDTKHNQIIINMVLESKDRIVTAISPIYQELDILETANQTEPKDDFKKYKGVVKDIEKRLQKIKQIESQLQDHEISNEASNYGDFFESEAKKNKTLSHKYLKVIIFFSIALAIFVYCFFKIEPIVTANGLFELIIKSNFLSKIFIFSILLLMLTLFRREYLALRHQYTLNIHRHNALKSHKEILTSIKETESASDKEISNAILLELTKAMFNPQNTGFVNQENTSQESKIIEISRSLFNSSPKH